jgi:hypothetical protein
MTRTGDKNEVPPKFDDEGNLTNNDDGSKSGASAGSNFGGPHEKAREAHDQK